MENEATAYRIRRYLLRDYLVFPARSLRYWVENNLADASQRYFSVDESSTLLEEFLPLEENNGCIPEQGINPSNYDSVRTHKKTVYLQSPKPIMANARTYAKLPYQARPKPAVPDLASLVGCVVQELFHAEDQQPAYFQWLVMDKDREHYPV